jgi:hypothetical protein
MQRGLQETEVSVPNHEQIQANLYGNIPELIVIINDGIDLLAT